MYIKKKNDKFPYYRYMYLKTIDSTYNLIISTNTNIKYGYNKLIQM